MIFFEDDHSPGIPPVSRKSLIFAKMITTCLGFIEDDHHSPFKAKVIIFVAGP